MAAYRPDAKLLELGPDFYDAVEPAVFPKCVPRFVNQRSAGRVGLELDGEGWAGHFCRFEPLAGNLAQPLALRYHGHQFRVYNPDIGDGRGFLFAQLRDDRDRLLDLGTKGSGQTPYSRFGDGRLTLKGGVREVLATEMLEALGVETSKTFSLIETGEGLERNDEPSPTRSSVLVRLSHGHIRIGTFQRLALLEQRDEMRALVDYCLENFFGQEGGEDGPVRFLDLVSQGTARLAASYIAAGFVHGVLNSDNIAITAESFDYGPWRFTPHWDGAFTAAYFDHNGLYAFGRQPEAIHWDLVQLAASLRLLAEADVLMPALEVFPERFQQAMRIAMLGRLGVRPRDMEQDKALINAFESALLTKSVTIDRAFFDWRGGRRRGSSPADEHYRSEAFAGFVEQVAGYEPAVSLDHDYWSDAAPCSVHIEEVEHIWAGIDESDDWTLFYTKIDEMRRMGEAMGNNDTEKGWGH